MSDVKIKGFREKVHTAIDRHEREASKLKRWMELLDEEGFDWDDVTEAQAWAITHVEPCDKSLNLVKR